MNKPDRRPLIDLTEGADPPPPVSTAPYPLRPLLDILGWTRDHLADRLECDARLLRRWESRGFPPVVMDWLQRRARALEEDPAPDWQTWRAEE